MARIGKPKPHIKIGSYYFSLDESIDAGTSVGSLYRPHYRWTIQSYFSPATVEAGAAENERALRTWFFNDFSGGEGARNWSPDDPTVYDYAYGMNPRIRGQITGRPSRSRDSLTGTPSTATAFMYFAVAGNTLWAAAGPDVWSLDQTNPVSGSWTAQGSNLGAGVATDSTYTCAGSDPNRLLLGEEITGNTTFKIRAASLSGNTASNYATLTNGALAGMVCEITSVAGFIYSLEYDLSTSLILRRYDVSKSYDYATNPVGRISVSNGIPVDSSTATFANFKSPTDTQSWYTGIAPTNNSVFFFVSTTGSSRVYEYRVRDATYPIWTAPDGFTVRDITYANGYLFIVGHWGPNGSNAGFGAVFVHQKDSQDTIFVENLGMSRGLNAQLSCSCATYAANLLVADGAAGRIWNYDADEDGISMFDSIATVASQSDNSVGGYQGGTLPNTTASFQFDTTRANYVTDMITWGGVRFMAINDGAGQAFQILRYRDDEPANRQAGTATGNSEVCLVTGINDFNLPFQQKFLTGIDVMWKLDPNQSWTSGQKLSIDYDVDGLGFVNAGVIDVNHADRNKGRTFLTIASPPQFTVVRLRISTSGSSGVMPPICIGAAAEAQSFQEILELIVALKNPVGNTRRGPKATSDSAWLARSYLRTLARSGAAITVIDGYADPRAGQTSTYTMVIQDVEDIITRDGEGSCRVTLSTV